MASAAGLLSLLACALALVAAASSRTSASGSWSDVSELLNAAIQNHTFPGCVAIVASAKGTLFAQAFGSLTYDTASPQVSRPPPLRSALPLPLSSISPA